MTITTENEPLAVVFDYASHDAEGKALAENVKAKQTALDLAAEEVEAAREAEEDLDILNDSNSKITKIRLDHERAEAKLSAAKTALSVAERKLGRWNDGEVAELLRPFMADLTNHPVIGIYTSPVEPDWATLPVPCLVAIQKSPTTMGGRVVRGVIAPDGGPGWGRCGAEIELAYLYDPGLHRDILGDTSDLLRKTREHGVSAYASERARRLGDLVRELRVTHGNSVRDGEARVSRVKLPIAEIWPEIPIIRNVSIDRLDKSLTNQVADGVRSIGRALGRTLIGSDVDTSIISSRTGKDGIVTTVVEARGAVADAYGVTVSNGESWSQYAGSTYRRQKGHVDSNLGRCAEVSFSPDGYGYRVLLTYVSRTA